MAMAMAYHLEMVSIPAMVSGDDAASALPQFWMIHPHHHHHHIYIEESLTQYFYHRHRSHLLIDKYTNN